MKHIAIISASVREGAKTPRVAQFFKNYIEENNLASTEILSLKDLNFPLFTERLKFQQQPSPEAMAFAEKIKTADGVLIVTPEYNGGYPAALKNAVDLLTEEWKHKVVAVSMVSAGPFGGMQVITSLQFSLWKLGAVLVPAMFPVPQVEKNFNEDGSAVDKEATEKRAAAFLKELLWLAEKLTN